MKANEVKARHVFHVNPESNGGESIMIETLFLTNGDKITDEEGIFINQEISLDSYGNSASLKLFTDTLTPEKLRQLANELEQTRNKITE